MKSHDVKVAAEAFAAGLFAHAGFDVLVQYGADQPGYDLMVSKGQVCRKVSVKGSQEGSWGFGQKYLSNADYSRAIDQWLASQDEGVIFCLVQFKLVELGECPRVYLATPQEIASRLRSSAGKRGATILHEDHRWTGRAAGAGTRERLPDSWRFSVARVEELMR